MLSLSVLVIGLLLTYLLRHGFDKWDTKPFIALYSSHANWQEIFDRPSAVSVVPLKTGTASGDRAIVMDTSDPSFQFLSHRHKSSDVIAYWIHHEKYGDFLVDGGLNSSFNKYPPYGNYSLLLTAMMKLYGVKTTQPAGDDLSSQLQRYQVHPRQVFLTHLHADHVAGISSLPSDVALVFGKKEPSFLNKAFAGNLLAGKLRLFSIDFAQTGSMHPFQHAVDLLGDGSFWALSTPGHSPDHISYLVNGKSGPVLITGDAAAYYDQLKYRIKPTPNIENIQQAVESLATLKAFVDAFPGIKVFVGHELRDGRN